MAGDHGDGTVRTWEVPDAGLAEAHLQAARHVVGTELGGVRLALIGGSLAAGLGNTTSDVNVYVIAEQAARKKFDHGGVQVTVTPLDPDAVRAVVEPRDTIDVDELALTVQLAHARRLQASAEWVTVLDRLDCTATRKLVVSHHANAFVALTADCFGALRSGDLFTAVTASRLALLASAEAALASAGDLYYGPKHLFRRLARAPITADWCFPVWDLADRAFPPAEPISPAQVRAVVESRQLTGNLLLAWCMTDGWHEPLKSLPQPHPMLDLGPRRSPYFVALRPGDDWVLTGPRHTYAVSEAVIRLWRRLGGYEVDRLARVLADEEPHVAGIEMDQIEAAIGTLRRIGAIEYPPHRPGDMTDCGTRHLIDTRQPKIMAGDAGAGLDHLLDAPAKACHGAFTITRIERT